MPKQGQIEEWFKRFETRTKQSLGLTDLRLAQSLKGLSFAEIEDFGMDVMRKIALQQQDADSKRIVGRCLDQWKQRFSMMDASSYQENN